MSKKEFTFDEATHSYKLDGKPLTGVTTVLGIIAKPALIPWATKMSAEYIAKNATKNSDKNYIVTPEILKASKSAHRSVRDRAANIGTITHKIIEEAIQRQIEVNNGKPEPIVFKEYQNLIKENINNKTITRIQANKMHQSIQEFSDWCMENVSEFVESEKRLYSEKNWYAGTVDIVYKDKEGKMWIADIKTSSGIYKEMFAQMGGYDIAYFEMTGSKIDGGYVVIRLDKKTAKLEVVGVKDLDMCRELFLHSLGVYRLLNNMII